jgi:hypothetical protein
MVVLIRRIAIGPKGIARARPAITPEIKISMANLFTSVSASF